MSTEQQNVIFIHKAKNHHQTKDKVGKLENVRVMQMILETGKLTLACTWDENHESQKDESLQTTEDLQTQ